MSNNHSENGENNDDSQDFGLPLEDVRELLAQQKKIPPMKDNVENAYEAYMKMQDTLDIDGLRDYYNKNLLNPPIYHVNSTLEMEVNTIRSLYQKKLVEMMSQPGKAPTKEQKDFIKTIQ